MIASASIETKRKLAYVRDRVVGSKLCINR